MNQETLRELVQEEKALSAEEKLHKALARLQNGKPLRTKAKAVLLSIKSTTRRAWGAVTFINSKSSLIIIGIQG
jgi:hypothetical protein